jgi:predicted HicB family RNase H-like nuclease
MSNFLGTYKGYTAQVDVDVKAGLLYGRVLDLKDVISFQGLTVEEAIRSFHDSVDAYLAFCEELGDKPEKAFSGHIPFRTNAEHHRKILIASQMMNKSINAWMDEALTEAAERVIENFEQRTVRERELIGA